MGLNVSFSGYSDKLPVFVEEVRDLFPFTELWERLGLIRPVEGFPRVRCWDGSADIRHFSPSTPHRNCMELQRRPLHA